MGNTVIGFVSPSAFGAALLKIQPDVVPVFASHRLDAQNSTISDYALEFGPPGTTQRGIQQMFTLPYGLGMKSGEGMGAPFRHSTEFGFASVPPANKILTIGESALLMDTASSRVRRMVGSIPESAFESPSVFDAALRLKIAAVSSNPEGNITFNALTAGLASLCLRDMSARETLTAEFETAAEALHKAGQTALAAIITEAGISNIDYTMQSTKEGEPAKQVDQYGRNLAELRTQASGAAATLWFTASQSAKPVEKAFALSRSIYLLYGDRSKDHALYSSLYDAYGDAILETGSGGPNHPAALDAYVRSVYYLLESKSDSEITWSRCLFKLEKAMMMAEDSAVHGEGELTSLKAMHSMSGSMISLAVKKSPLKGNY